MKEERSKLGDLITQGKKSDSHRNIFYTPQEQPPLSEEEKMELKAEELVEWFLMHQHFNDMVMMNRSMPENKRVKVALSSDFQQRKPVSGFIDEVRSRPLNEVLGIMTLGERVTVSLTGGPPYFYPLIDAYMLRQGVGDKVYTGVTALGPGQLEVHSHSLKIRSSARDGVSFGDIGSVIAGPRFIDPDTKEVSVKRRLFGICVLTDLRDVLLQVYEIDIVKLWDELVKDRVYVIDPKGFSIIAEKIRKCISKLGPPIAFLSNLSDF